ncbi:hypothetical protein [Streptomyces specialis]|uniref:hypothetical protein n=1 Tax=Streptomyces specialis TaxID=498367 RepID=UPI00073EF135|nr:hypothetical protein [Streptomyces specialis]
MTRVRRLIMTGAATALLAAGASPALADDAPADDGWSTVVPLDDSWITDVPLDDGWSTVTPPVP